MMTMKTFTRLLAVASIAAVAVSFGWTQMATSEDAAPAPAAESVAPVANVPIPDNAKLTLMI